jgi:dTDP-4-amino-4,6-dideoxygalactose transaminase
MNTAQLLSVPFHVAATGDDEAYAAAEVIRSGWLTMGPQTVEFERQFAGYVGARHAIAVSSCTAALHLALGAMGIGAGDEVLTPTTTFTATAAVIAHLGGRPVLVDIDPATMCMDPNDAERKITGRTRALLPVHFAGQPADMDAILALASHHGLRVIEDAAHSLPASYRGTPVGAIGEATAFSFYATKTLSTGEGGMLTTEDDDIAAYAQKMRLHGIERDAWKRYSADGSWYYEVVDAGFKYNFNDIAAAIGLVQLRKCNRMQANRMSIAGRYNQAFSALPQVQIPAVCSDRQTAWHLYVLRLNLEQLTIDRAQFIEKLKERGIGTSVHFIPLHLHPYYRRTFGYQPGDLPVSEAEYQRCVSLPLFPTMTDEQTEHVMDSVREVLRNYSR